MSSVHIASREPFRYYVLLLVAWTGAWLLHESAGIRDFPSGAKLAYWTIAKLIIWIAPILLIVKYALRRPVADYLGLVHPRRGVRVGLTIGAAFVALSACVDLFIKTYTWPSPGWGLLSALTVAPVFEEVMFRGFALRALEDGGCRFWPANLISALMFLGLHLPGWHFATGLGRPQIVLGGSIVIIGLAAGYAKRRASSTWASVALHFMNNLYSAFVR